MEFAWLTHHVAYPNVPFLATAYGWSPPLSHGAVSHTGYLVSYRSYFQQMIP